MSDEREIDETVFADLDCLSDERILEELKGNLIESPQTEDEILEGVEKLLNTPYDRAKRTHIWAEEERGEHNWVAMTNFRDALDHMSKIFSALEEGDIAGARENLGEMEAHIQRAAFDSAQSVPDKKLDELFDEKMPPILYRITQLDAPSEQDYQKRLRRVREHMVAGREKKAQSMEESVREFKMADDHISELERKFPSRREVRWRLIILGSVFITVLAFLLTIYSFNSGFI